MRVKLRSLQKSSSSFNTEEEIEADPFGYILSPSLLSAGIRNDKSARSPSPFWIKASSSTSKDSSFSFSSDCRLVKLKRWILRIESWYVRRGRQHHHQDQTSNPAKSSSIRTKDGGGARSTSTTTGQVRGRSDARTSSSANGEDHLRMRSTPGRQHLWRKPSESLWAVLEESEDVTP